MKNYTNIAIVASFFGLWMDSYFSTKLQIMSGFIFIFTFGILHGANDLLLIKNIKSKQESNSALKVLIYYLVVVLSGILLFFLVPEIALSLFIIVSAYHFGEQQWQNLEHEFPKGVLVLFQFFYGLLVLLLLFNSHPEQVQGIIFTISKVNIPATYIELLLKISATIFLVLSIYFYWKLESIRKKLLTDFFYLVLFTIIFHSSSLIWGFAIYFVLWHSIPSIIDQIKFLNGSYSLKYFIAYCRAAGIYWFLSIVGISLLYFVFREQQIFNALFFSFLAAITFPHALVITKMLGGKKNGNKK